MVLVRSETSGSFEFIFCHFNYLGSTTARIEAVVWSLICNVKVRLL